MNERAPSFSRLKTALFCGEPDYVPLVELGIDPTIKETILGRPVKSLADDVAFWMEAGYDYVKLQPGIDMNPARIQPKEGSRVTSQSDGSGDRTWASQHQGVITSMAEFEAYEWPAPESVDYSRFEEVSQHLREDVMVIGQYGDVFTMAWEMMGFETFSICLYDNPGLVENMFNKIGRIVYNLYENMIAFDHVGAVWYSDDLAYVSGPMVSPDVFRRHLFPWMKKIGELAAGRGIPFLYHSDGDLWSLMDDLLACGINALHPIEPKAMDIAEVKRELAGRVCVIGNVDLGYTLTRGTPEETEQEVKEKIRLLAPGGGYCLGSSNSIPDYVRPPNYRAMLETTRRFGKYPIEIPDQSTRQGRPTPKKQRRGARE